MSSNSVAQLSRRDWVWLVAVWSIAVATMMARGVLAPAEGPFFVDTDDAMRMVVVRDFLAGQGWYDTIQHRLNTPFGADIHWSRFVDLPLAALLFIGQIFTDAHHATLFVGTVWPLFLLGVLLFLSLRIARELVGPESILPALVLPIVSPAVLAEFTPGRLDHHNVVIVLTMACLLSVLVAQRRPVMAVLAGFFAASAMAIAIEALPVVMATILALGLLYIADPARAPSLRRFGLSFAGFMLVHLALARPPERWLEAACDAISPVYALAGLAVGAAYLIVSLVPAPRQAWQRFLLLAALGLAATAIVALAYPHCLAGPYGDLDPWLKDNWMDAVIEAKPWHAALSEIPAYAITVAVPAVLGAIATLFAMRNDRTNRLGWLALLLFIIATALIMLVQIRGARLAVLPTIPAAAWLILKARERYLHRANLLRALGLLGAWLAFSGVVLVVLVNLVLRLFPGSAAETLAETRADKSLCLASGSFADLRGLAPEHIMAPVDLGAHILLETPHAVVAAPYHRNEEGMLDAFRFLNGPVDEAREIAKRRGLGLFVTCDAMPEMWGSGLQQDGTLLNLLAAGTPPDWLEDVSLGGPLKVYAILP
ncbi:MAG: hypothetical protein GX970_05320 [Phyllobacteriaceae bacterium]|nr:hypothetical protein [Phyllobacteriaceae bacterium]